MNPRTISAILWLLCASAAPARGAGLPWSGGGPDLGWVTALALPKGPGGPLIAGTYGGGIWRSDDLGQSWSDISSPSLAGSVVWCFAYRQFSGEDQLYAGTEFLGLWRARNLGGTLWDDLNTGLQQNGRLGIRGIAIHPHDPQVISVATSNGMFTSNTGGVIWPDSLRWGGGQTYEDVAVSPLAPITTFALQSFALYLSPDKGNTFQDIGAGLPGRGHRDFAIWPGTLDERYVVSLGDGVYRDDGSGIFQSISPTPSPTAMRNYAIELDAAADRLYLASERGLWTSDDRGGSWTKHNGRAGEIFLPEIWSMQIVDSASEHLMLGSFRYGVLETGASLSDWIPRNQGLRAAWVESIDAWNGGVLAATAHGEIYLSIDQAGSWSNVTGDLDAIRPRDILRLPSGRWLLTGGSGHWLSDDQGAHWREPDQGPTSSLGYRLLRAGGDVYLGTRQGVWHSDDDGDTWLQLDNGLPTDLTFNALAAADDGTLAFAANGDGIYLWRPTDLDFQRIRTGAGLGTSYRDVKFRGGDAHMLFVAAAGQLKLWQIGVDGSASLRQNLEDGLPGEPSVERMYWDRASEALIVGLADEGVYRSARLGAEWVQIDAGIRVPRIEDLAVDEQSGRIYLGTLGSGLWGASLAELAGEALVAPTAQLFRLVENPLREVAHIEFELERAARVEFELFDLRGRRVRRIDAGDLAAGEQRLVWRAEDDRGIPLASGRYYLRGRFGGRIESRPLTILR